MAKKKERFEIKSRLESFKKLFSKRRDYIEREKWEKEERKREKKRKTKKEPPNPRMSMSGPEFFEIFIVIVVFSYIQAFFNPANNIERYFLTIPISFLFSGIIYLGFNRFTGLEIYSRIAITKDYLPHCLWILSIVSILLLDFFGFL